MKFGSVPLEEAEGCILAHSVKVHGKRFRKGMRLTADDITQLSEAGIGELTVARLEPGDLGEDEAARRIARALTSGAEGFSCTAPFTGRVNIHACLHGLVELDTEKILALNSIDTSITLATMPQLRRVAPSTLVATVKIITYAATERDVASAESIAAGVLRLRKPVFSSASLILTRTGGLADRLEEKGVRAVNFRLRALGIPVGETIHTRHEMDAVCNAMNQSRGELLLLLTGSATSDPEAVGPAALRQAGGKLHRFGMPVDPGNLLFLGELRGRPVIGLPGCVRSPALNGADWVLERIACGVEVTDRDIAAMGAGGLLKEIPLRPHPRAAVPAVAGKPYFEIVILDNSGAEVLRRVLSTAVRSDADRVRVVSANTVDGELVRQNPGVSVISAPRGVGRAELIRIGIAAMDSAAAAVLLFPADAQPVTSEQLDRLMAAFSPADGREICRFASSDGTVAPPALFGRRFFESLASLSGDRGAVSVSAEAESFAVEIQP